MAIQAPEYIESVAQIAQNGGYLNQPYEPTGCWRLVRNLYRDGLGIHLPESQVNAAKELVEVWFDEPGACDISEVVEPWDIVVYRVNSKSALHVGLIASRTQIIHTRTTYGVTIDDLRLISPFLMQVCRHTSMVDFSKIPRLPHQPFDGQIDNLFGVRSLVSPVRSRDGQWRFSFAEQIDGRRLEEYLSPSIQYVQVIKNGVKVPDDLWESMVPQPGEDWLLIPAWEGTEIVVAIIIEIAIAVAVSLATTYLFAPPDPFINKADPTFSADGIQSTIGPGRPVPVRYGRRRTGIQYLQRFTSNVVTFVDDGSIITTFGIVSLSGGTAIGEDDGTFIEVTVDGPHGVQKTQKVLITGIENVSTRLLKRWVIQDITSPTSFTLNGTDRISISGYTPGTGTAQFGQELRALEALDETSRFHFLGCIGQGEMEEIETETIEINGQPIGNFPDVVIGTVLGTPSQSALTGFADIRNTIANGTLLDDDVSGHNYTTQSAVNGFTLNLEFRAGLSHTDELGSVVTNTVDITYQYRVSNPPGAYTQPQSFQARSSKTGVVRLGIEKLNLPLDTYDINIRAHSPRWNNPSSAYIPTLAGVTHITDNASSYPNWAVLGGSFNFNPETQGQFPNVTVISKGKKVRVGSFGATPTYSSNWAWCLMDYMTDIRYGMVIPDVGIDLPAFQVFADFCDEDVDGRTRHVASLAIDQRVSQQRIFELMLQPTRTEMLWLFGKWSPRVTRNDAPSYIFSWSNMRNFDLTFVRDENETNVIQVQYQREDNNYEEEIYEYPEVIDQLGAVNAESIELQSVTNTAEVAQFAKLSLNLYQLPAFSFSFEAPPEAVLVQKHSVIGISHDTMGWGEAGRVVDKGANTAITVDIDQQIEIVGGNSYHVYMSFPDGSYEVRPLLMGAGTYDRLSLDPLTPFSQIPTEVDCRWVFGKSIPVDTAVRLARVDSVVLLKDGWVRISGVHHNPRVYGNEPPGPVIPISGLRGLKGPPPPILSATIVENLQSFGTGARQSVVFMAWEIASQGDTFAPYGGARILRREILANSSAGATMLGETQFGEGMSPTESQAGGFVRVGSVEGFTFSDTDILVGLTYEYRVIPVSGIGTPNNTGFYDLSITIHGGTATEFTPPPPQNLQLFVLNETGSFVEVDLADEGLFETGTIFFIGEDIQFRWSPPAGFEEGRHFLFVNQYRIQIATGTGAVVLHNAMVQDTFFNYPIALNLDDSLVKKLSSPQRDLVFRVWSRSNVNVESSTFASIRVINEAVDMSSFSPTVRPLLSAAQIDWTNFVAPIDISKYDILLGTSNPPSVVDQTVGGQTTKTILTNLMIDQTYYTRMRAHDPFGIGGPSTWTPVVQFTPGRLGLGSLDTNPPNTPTGLALVAGAERQPDGTFISFVDATWNASIDPEGAEVDYQVNYRIGVLPTLLQFSSGAIAKTRFRISPAPGLTEIGVQVAALDRLRNPSDFSAEVTIQTAGDLTPPGNVTSLLGNGYLRTIVLQVAPPSDSDLSHIEVWASLTNNRTNSFLSGRLAASSTFYTFNFDLAGSSLNNNETWFFWVRPVDRSGNIGNYFPVVSTAGVSATTIDPGLDPITGTDIVDRTITGIKIALAGAGDGILSNNIEANQVLANHILANQIDTVHLVAGSVTSSIVSTAALLTNAAQIANALITDAHIANLTADKITSSRLKVLLALSVSNNVFIDGLNNRMLFYDNQNPQKLRVVIGNLSFGDTDWGLRIFDPNGVLLFDTLQTGVQAAGIRAGIIDASHIQANTIGANQIQTGTAVIEHAAQIGQAVIETASIGDLQVNTIKVADGAITSFIGVKTVSSFQNLTGAFDTVPVQVVVPTVDVGDIIEVSAQIPVTGQGNPNSGIQFITSIIKNGTPVQDTAVGGMQFVKALLTPTFFETITAPGGPVTWGLELQLLATDTTGAIQGAVSLKVVRTRK